MKLIEPLLKITLLLMALDFFITSVFGIFFPQQALSLYRALYGTTVPATKEIFLIFKPWGTFGLFGSLVTLLPLMDRKRYRGVLFALFIFILLRIFIRLFYHDLWAESFELSLWRNFAHVSVLVLSAAIVLAGALVSDEKKAKRDPKTEGVHQ